MRTEKTGALPEVMRFADGRPVETAEQWAARWKEDGHAILPSDMERILDYCDMHLLGKSRDAVPGSLSDMKGRLFLEANRRRLDPVFDQYEAEIRSALSRK